MADSITVESRADLGSSASRRLRRAGKVPAVLYGHGLENANLTIAADEISAAIRHGSQMIELIGAVKDSALIKEIQWDAFGQDIVHLDLTRVSLDETVQVSVQIELRGEAPGSKAGGNVEMMLHDIEIECPAGKIPEKLELSVNTLEVGDSLTAADLQLPEDAKLTGNDDQMIVQCVAVVEEEEEEGEVSMGEAAEPEVIGKKDDEEDQAD